MRTLKIPYAWLLLGPYVAFAIGFLLNAIVMAVNGGQMPVLFPGGCPNGGFGSDDIVHACMTHITHLKFIADWIVINHFGIASPGDFFEWVFSFTYIPAAIAWVTLLIKDHNKEQS